jgi:D-alanyl-D-alanine dipeptidase
MLGETPMRLVVAYLVVQLATLSLLEASAREPPRAKFVDAASAVQGLVVDMRYFGTDNFVGARIDGYEQPRCLLTKAAASALAAVQGDLAGQGLSLKVFDCYRPARAVAHFMRWARDIGDVARKRDYYPDLDKRNLFKEGYIAERSGHSRGSTVDLTLVRRSNSGAAADGWAPMAGEGELDMGTPFDLFSPKSWPSNRSVSAPAQQNRALLATAMTRRGFRPYAKEWWHFTLANEPFPHTYFDIPVQ